MILHGCTDGRRILADASCDTSFKQGFSWTQEIATLRLAFWFQPDLAWPSAFWQTIHISIEMFTSHLPEKVISIIESIDHVLIAVFGGVMLYYGIVIMQMTKSS